MSFADVYGDIEAQIPEGAAGILFRTIDVLGLVGLNNAGALGTDAGDCSDCGCEPDLPIYVDSPDVSPYRTYAGDGEPEPVLTPPATFTSDGTWFGYGNGQLWAELRVDNLPFTYINHFQAETIGADMVNNDMTLEHGVAFILTLFDEDDVQRFQTVKIVDPCDDWTFTEDDLDWTDVASSDYLVLSVAHTTDGGHTFISGYVGGRNVVISGSC